MSSGNYERFLQSLSKEPTADLLRKTERALAEKSLEAFLRLSWKYIDPAPWVNSYHIGAIAEHLEAVSRGQIRRLIINQPPRTSKSSCCSVAWPAWTWAQQLEEGEEDLWPNLGPKVKFLFASYAQTLTERDAVRCRRLIESPWYQALFGDRYQLTGDVNTKSRYATTAGGERLSTSVDSKLTGEGGQCIVIDDPHNVKDAIKSEASRENVLTWWDESMPSRLNDPKTGAFVIVMQRSHEADLTGHILKEDDAIGEWELLRLPMEYEPQWHCVVRATGWQDPRRFEQLADGSIAEKKDLGEGELLCPERYGPEELERFKRMPYMYASQFQQRPVPRGGGIFKEDWWQHWPPEGIQEVPYTDPVTGETTMRIPFPDFEYIVASLDTALEDKKEADYSALTIWGLWRSSGDRVTGATRMQAGPAGPEGRWTVHQGGKAMTPMIPPDVARLTARTGRSASGNPEDDIVVPLTDHDHPKLMLMYAWQKRLDLHGPPDDRPPDIAPRDWASVKYLAHRQKSWGLVEWVVHTCRLHKVDTLLIERQAAGKQVHQELRRLFNNDGMHVVMVNARGDKVARAYATQHWFSNGLVYAPTTLAWCQNVIYEMSVFPKHPNDDLVDSTTMALQHFNQTGLLVRRDEYDSSYQDSLKPKRRMGPLYPV